MRMDKLLAAAEGLSRAQAKRLLASGAVTADGRVVRSGAEKVDPQAQSIRVGGRPVQYRAHTYLVMNKPLGVVSSTDDPESRTVLELVPPELAAKGLFPVGRLDKYSEGMLLLSDDGDFAHRVLAPRSHLPKVYDVTLDAPIIDEALVARFAEGVSLGGGERSSPAILEPLAPDRARVTVFEGIYHQVRRMFDRNGAHVTRLFRVQIGGLPLDPALEPGQVRALSEEELLRLGDTGETGNVFDARRTQSV